MLFLRIYLVLHCLFIAHHAIAETESNDFASTANILTSGVSMTGQLSSAADQDYFQIVVSDSGTLTVTTTHFSGNDVQILNSALEVIGGWSTSGTTTNKFGITSPGSYYIRVYETNTFVDTDTYTITATVSTAVGEGEIENNNSANTANNLNSGVSISGQLYSASDEDYFRIAVSSPGTLIVTTEHFSGNDVQVLNSSLEVIGGWSTSGTTTNQFGIALGGTYYIRIFETNSFVDSDTYVLTATTTTETGKGEIESNNSAGIATVLTSGVGITGQLSSATDQDYFQISVDNPGTLSITTEHFSGNDVQVLNASLEVIGGWSTSGTTTNEFGITAPGNYFVRIFETNSFVDSDAYKLTATVTTDTGRGEVEFNNSANTATVLTSGVEMSGQLSSATDEDFFQIPVGSSGSVTVTTNHFSGNEVQVLNSASEVIGAWSTSGTTTNQFDVTSAGSYYVRIYETNSFADSDTYKVTVSYAGDPPSAANLTLTNLGSNSVTLSASVAGVGSTPVESYTTECAIESGLPRREARAANRVFALGKPSGTTSTSLQARLARPDSSIYAPETYLPNPELAEIEIGDTLTFTASSGQQISSQVYSVVLKDSGNTVIKSLSDDASLIVVVTPEGNFFSRIQAGNGLFQTRIVGGSTVSFSTTDGGIQDYAFAEDLDLERLRAEQDPGNRAPSQARQLNRVEPVTVTLGVLVDDVISENLDVLALVDYLEAVTNESYANSDIQINLDVVAVGFYDPLTSFSDMSVTRDWITCGSSNCSPLSGVNSAVRNWREKNGADIVAQLVGYGTVGGACGIAQLPWDFNNITTRDRLLQYTYSVTALVNPLTGSVCPDIVMAHEIGHNFGLFHDRDTLSRQGWTGVPSPVYSYGFGYKVDNVFGTIMSYTPADTYLRQFSNPDLQFNNFATGVPIGAANEAHAAIALANVASYYEALFSNEPIMLFSVSASAGPGGTINPNGTVTVPEGGTVAFSVSPDADYALKSITGCGVTQQNNLYVTAPVSTNCDVSATFIQSRWSKVHTTPEVTFRNLPIGYSYSCQTRATNASGTGPLSNAVEFALSPPTVPSAPIITSWDTEEGIISLRVSVDDGGSALISVDASCAPVSEDVTGGNELTGSSATNYVSVKGLDPTKDYICNAIAVNSIGVSAASASTPAIRPEANTAGLPIWLLYEASKK